MGATCMPRAPSRTYRLDHETLGLMAALAQKFGVAQTDVIRMAVRRIAATEGVQWTPPTPESEEDSDAADE